MQKQTAPNVILAFQEGSETGYAPDREDILKSYRALEALGQEIEASVSDAVRSHVAGLGGIGLPLTNRLYIGGQIGQTWQDLHAAILENFGAYADHIVSEADTPVTVVIESGPVQEQV